MVNPNGAITRREAIRVMALASVVLYLKGCASTPNLLRSWSDEGRAPRDISPLDRRFADIGAPLEFFGDQPHRAHSILRNPLTYQITAPVVSESAKVVVVGGGMGGLTAAYLLRHHQPLLLEQADRLGGNSKGQVWGDETFPLGAAYYLDADTGSPLEKLYQEWGLHEIAQKHQGQEPYMKNAHWYESAEQSLSPEHRSLATMLEKHFAEVLSGKSSTQYPDYPTDDARSRRLINKLDRISFQAHLKKVLGLKQIPIEILASLELYFQSAFNGSTSEVSAAAGLNFFAAESGAIRIAPGGNAGVADRIASSILKAVSKDRLRTQSVVYAVEKVGSRVMVDYLDKDGKAHRVAADAVVLACPKFVVNKILHHIEAARAEAISKLEYRGYLVANLLMNGSLSRRFYDLYLESTERVDASSRLAGSRSIDAVWGNYQTTSQNKTVLSLYRPLPYQGGRSEMYSSSYEDIRAQFENQIKLEILPAMGWTLSQLQEIRVARWGHALCLAKPGLLANNVVNQLRAPHQDRVFFVNQDNWALPCMESAVTEALHWTPKVEALLRA